MNRDLDTYMENCLCGVLRSSRRGFSLVQIDVRSFEIGSASLFSVLVSETRVKFSGSYALFLGNMIDKNYTEHGHELICDYEKQSEMDQVIQNALH